MKRNTVKRVMLYLTVASVMMTLCACAGNAQKDYSDYEEEGYVEEYEQFVPDEELMNITPEVVVVTDLADDSLMPENFLEERLGKAAFDSQQEIVDGLVAGEGYAYISVKGATEKVLLIADEFFDAGDKKCVISAYPYIKNENGQYVFGSMLTTNSTATPIAVSKDGLIYCATHDTIEKICIDKVTNGIMDMVYLYMDITSQEPSYGGFIRDDNDSSKPGNEIGAGDSSYYDKAFEEYNECEAVGFTLVE